jgi:cytoskeletal protein RodZ
MTSDDPGDGIFDHLDDSAPPLHGSEALTHVVARGQRIRRRRRSAYAVSTAVVVVAIAGSAIGLARAGHTSGNDETVTPLKTPTSAQTSASPHSTQKTSTQAPNGIGQTIVTTHHHHHHTPSVPPTAPVIPVCVSSTPTPPPPSVSPTVSPTATSSDTTAPTSTPTPTSTCTTPTPTTSASATATGTPSPPAVVPTS